VKEVEILNLSEEELKQKDVYSWPIWTKEISRFDWYYDSEEHCYILEGKVVVETKSGNKYEIKKGDYVIFKKGLSCVWDIKEDIKKHYNFF